jgi:parallel beta-helix repeat protein
MRRSMKKEMSKLMSLTLCAAMIANLVASASMSNLDSKNFEGRLENSPKTIWVDDDFVDDPPNHKWDTIQEGVSDASSGDTVRVYNGRYFGKISIDKIINLLGEDPTNTTIDGSGSHDFVEIQVDGVKLSGFRITNGSFGFQKAGIRITSSHNIISGNIVDSASYYGIYVHDPPKAPKTNTIEKNEILNNEVGIRLFDTASNIVASNRILNNTEGIHITVSSGDIVKNNEFSNNTYAGVGLWDSSGVTVDGNTFWFDGIDVHPFSKGNTITDNFIFGSHSELIALRHSRSNTISGNVMLGGGIYIDGDMVEYWNTHIIDTSNLLNGKPVHYRKDIVGGTIPLGAGQVILANCDGVLIENQEISGSSAAIQLGFSTNIVISRNTLSTSWYAIRLVFSKGNLIFHNNIIQSWISDEEPVINHWHHPVLLEGNYWSSYGGLDDGSGTGKHAIAGDGIGDTFIPHPTTDYDYYPIVKESGWIPENIPPVADAGPDQTVHVGDVVQFDGSGSYDPDAGWNSITVDPSGGAGVHSSLVLDSGDRPHIGYSDQAKDDLRYAKWTGSIWIVDLVDSLGDVGEYTSMALDTNDLPHISYYDATNCDLKYARWTGTDWLIETVDSWGDVGTFSSIALDDDDKPHISYQNFTRLWSRELKYAEWTGSEWNMTTVESQGSGVDSSVALDSDGNPHISYSNRWDLDLKYAKWTGGNWNVETVDSYGFVGLYSSVTLDANDNPTLAIMIAQKETSNTRSGRGVAGELKQWILLATSASSHP